MSSFSELYSQMRVQKGKSAVLRMLIELLDGDFLQSLDGKPKKILLTDEKLPVETETVDLVIQDLLALSKKVDEEVIAIQSKHLKVVPEEAPQVTPQ